MTKTNLTYIKYSNKFYNAFLKPFDRILFPVVKRDDLKKERETEDMPLNKIPNISDLYNPEWAETLKSISPVFSMNEESFHRKIWEFTHILYSLRKLGFLHPENKGLAIGAGREQILYFLAHKLKNITGIDLYEGNFLGGEDEPDIPMNPAKYAPFIYPEDNLELIKMDALDLDFKDNSFDFIFSASSIEHFGTSDNIKRSVSEMYRVLKPGGACIITTELKLNKLAADIPNTKLFELSELLNLFTECKFEIDKNKTDIKIEEDCLINWVKLPHEVYKSPHVIQRFFKSVFTSAAFVLRKSGDKVVTGEWKETEKIQPFTYNSSIEVKPSLTEFKADEEISLDIKLENKTNFHWYTNGMSHRIAIGIKLLDRNHVALNHNFGEILIPQDIKKGESLTFTAKFSSSDFKPGEYKLFFDIKKEHITWFADQGEKPAIFDITVLS